MASQDYKEYLANRVLAESQPVTYRLLSRALEVNVNVAKQMLYDFHTKQTAKKPNSVHATYLLTGKKRTTEQTNGTNGHGGDDTAMRSSPFMSSLPEPEQAAEKPVPKTSIVLAREEELEKTKVEFEELTSIHVYSLEPGPLENLNVLSVCNQEVAIKYATGDPLERWRIYGSIHNPYVKRRTAKFNPAAVGSKSAPATKATAPKPTVKPTAAVKDTKKEAVAAVKKGSAQEETKLGSSTPQPSAAPSLQRADSRPNLKKEQSFGDLFKSFAKAKPKAPEAEKPKSEDDEMQGMSEDEGDDDDEPAIKYDEAKAAAAKQAREERERKLREMMEADVEMPDAPTENEEPVAAPVQQETPAAAESDTMTVEGGRRRGKRRVMKKKKVKDEDGYLVTKEEAVWESFSEDEPEPKKLKPAAKPTTTAKPKKAGGKAQGSIASFFKKA